MTDDRYNELIASEKFQIELKPKLDHLRELLKNGQASVMVGAGFSKNAEIEDGVDVKDWKDLAKVFYKEAYDVVPTDSDLALREPIELASRVTAKFGHDYIDKLLEEIIPDDKIKPGKLHKELVSLPWADIYTTNYDTLLERSDSSNAYYWIRGEKEVPQKNGARIIKLHGSFPDVKPYIIDQDDYHNYHTTHPLLTSVFKNTLITNELYLIGFSGDDSNFLSWIRWFRNKCNGIDIPPVYLLDVSPKPIKEADSLYKKKDGIEIIQMPTGFQNIPEYFEFIFRYLKEAQTECNNEWNISVSYEQLRKVRNFKISGGLFSNNINESELANLIETYRNIRESYPGWAFLHISQFQKGFESLFDNEISEVEQIIKRIPKDSNLDFLYEFEWRLRKAFYPISIFPWFVTKCETAIKDAEETDYLDNVKLQNIALALLSHYRNTFDIESFDALSNKILASIQISNSRELINRFKYETALQAISLLKYDKALDILNQWELNEDNYEGALWKSALLIEINREEEAYTLLVQIISRLSKSKVSDVKNTYLGAFLSIVNLFTPYKGKFETNIHVEPSFEVHSYFRYFKVHLYDALHKKQDRIESRSHGFNLDDANITRLMDGVNNSTQTRYASRIQMIWEMFGFPYRLGAITINTQLMQLSCDVLIQSNVSMIALNALLRAAQTDTSRNVIKKESIASLDRTVINKWVDLLLDKADSVDDWSASTVIVYRLSIIILIILSRLSVILDEARIKRLIPFLLKIYASRNRTYKNEYLKTVFKCLKEAEQGYVVQLASECPIKVDEASSDIWISQEITTDYVMLSNKAIELVINGLKEADTNRSNNAYIRATKIYKYCNVEQKKELDAAIRLWRNKNLSKEVNATYSFNLVKANEAETKAISERLDSSISALKKRIELPKNNDGVIRFSGRAEDELATIRALCKLISKERVIDLYQVLDECLLEIVNSFEEEDSRLSSIFGPSKLYDMDAIAGIIAKCDSSLVCSKIKDSLYNKFAKIYDLGYPRYITIEALNPKSPILTESNLFNDILSTNEEIREQALEYLSKKGFSQYPKLWDVIWNKIVYSSTPEIVDYLKVIIKTVEHSEFVLPDNNMLLALFRNKVSEIDAGYICEGDKYDIIYRIKQLAGYISNMEDISEDVIQVMSTWMAGAEMDKNLPNDVILGFEEGVSLWKKHPKSQ